MKIEQFIERNKIEIEDHIKELRPSFDYQKFKEILIGAVSELEPLMVSSKLTDKKINEISQRHQRQRPDIDGSYFNDDFDMVSAWLLKYTKLEDAFQYARNKLTIIDNNKPYASISITPKVMPYKELSAAIEDYKNSRFNTNEATNTLIFDKELNEIDSITGSRAIVYEKKITKNYRQPETTLPPKSINITLPKIDETIYDAQKIFEKFNNVVFKCSEESFNSWLINQTPHTEQIEYILKFRQGKPAIAQLRKFIEKITGDTENTKDTYYKTVFGLEIKTAHNKTAINLNDTFKELNNCKLSK